MTAELFPGFTLERIDLEGVELRVRRGGSGPPLLLLHGHPQTHVMWHAVAPGLAERFTVVAPDLRGYGESSKPATSADHEPYSKRAMARDQVALMRTLGFERFGVCGHDRGGRCAYRLALDSPQAVTRLAVLDIVPTGDVFRLADARFGLAYWHWFFLAQPDDLPERMIGADPDAFYFQQRYQARDRFAPSRPSMSPSYHEVGDRLKCYPLRGVRAPLSPLGLEPVAQIGARTNFHWRTISNGIVGRLRAEPA